MTSSSPTVDAFAAKTIAEINLSNLLLGVGKVFEGLDFFFFTGFREGLGEEGGETFSGTYSSLDMGGESGSIAPFVWGLR